LKRAIGSDAAKLSHLAVSFKILTIIIIVVII